jgi:ketosteroid isomerase-like protein
MRDLTPEVARSHAEAWSDARNRRDLDAVMSYYAEDVAFCSPTVVKRWEIRDG